MAFIETQFPTAISRNGTGGPVWNTEVVRVNSGNEKRNQVWEYPLHRYDVTHAAKNEADKNELLAVFMVAAGRVNGFRYRDVNDHDLTPADGSASGVLGTGGVGDGTPTYQIYKNYSFGSVTRQRKIRKPVSTGLTPKRNGSAVTAGVGAGNYSVDTTTGIVTFVADASSNASSVTVGATTQVVLAANPGTLIAGKKLYLTGFAGAHAADLNSLAHTINSVTGSGPYTFTLATNTAGRTITLGSGAGKAYPQASDTLTITGEFDVPVRFDTDEMHMENVGPNRSSWGSITLTEDRNA